LLKSELTRLEKYVQELPEEQVTLVKEECNRLKAIWVQELFKPVKEDVLTRYLQFHQAGIITLSDAIGDRPEVQQELEQLIIFLQQSLYQYFDADHPVTTYFLRQVRGEVDGFLLSVEMKSKPVYLEKSLVDCIYTSIKDRVGEDLSYRKAELLLHFISLMREHLQIFSSSTTEALANLLYQANFNSPSFFRWFQQFLKKQMAEISGNLDSWIDDKIAELEELRPDKLKPFDTEHTPIDHALLNWLHLQKTDHGTNLTEQIGLNFSVAQFALFIRLFQLAGCFRENNLAKIQRFFSAHFTTKKQAHISLKSFARYFYCADQSTAAVVRDVFKRMIAHIDKHYFPD
jgi:hypothetical protein